MRGRWLKLLALLAALTLVAAACNGDDDGDDGADDGDGGEDTEQVERNNVDGVLKLGSILPSTGDLGVLGEPMNEAVAMALRDINEAGGVLGNDVELVAEDSGTDEEIANTAADRLIGPEQVDGVIGAASSRISLSIIDKVTGAEVVMCSPSNTSSDFTTYEDGGFYFRTAPPDNLQAQALAEAIAADEHTTVVVMHLADAYGQGFADDLVDALEEAGIDVLEQIAYDPQGTNFDADVGAAASADPEALVLIGFPETGATILQGMIEAGIGPADTAHYYTDGLQSGDLPTSVDPDDAGVLEGAQGTAPSAAPPDGAAFFPDAFAEFAPGVDTIFSAHAYDCTIVMALAAIAADTDDSTAIAEAMNGVTREGETCTTFADCKELLEAGTDIDYDGAAGTLDFVDAGEPGAGAYDVWEFNAEGEPETTDTVTIT